MADVAKLQSCAGKCFAYKGTGARSQAFAKKVPCAKGICA